MAGQVQLDYSGTPPFHLTAERLVSGKPVSVFSFKTENKREVVNVDFRVCTSYKVCNEGGCEVLPRRKFSLGQPVICK
jgi:hypothetical protein